MGNLLQRLVPEARIAVGHGQMGEDALEKVMVDFVAHKYDVLLATTIVENGLDIPNANTMIINRADRYGLSQLYQLRGRVGRSDRRAYAYLLIPPEDNLSPVAKKRLAAIREFSDLGSGFRVAALDLEIRGAGNLLGGEQSGHIEAVGFDMYMKLLEQTDQGAEGRGDRGRRPRDRQPARRSPDRRALHPRHEPAPDGLPPDGGGAIARTSSIGRSRKSRDRYGPPPDSIQNLADYAPHPASGRPAGHRIHRPRRPARRLKVQAGGEARPGVARSGSIQERTDVQLDPAGDAEARPAKRHRGSATKPRASRQRSPAQGRRGGQRGRPPAK